MTAKTDSVDEHHDEPRDAGPPTPIGQTLVGDGGRAKEGSPVEDAETLVNEADTIVRDDEALLHKKHEKHEKHEKHALIDIEDAAASISELSQTPLAGVRAESAPQAVDALDKDLKPMGFADRYIKEQVLGEGGMGTVTLSVDKQIGRRVAMKVLRPDRTKKASMRRRFIREARVQGQLEHPALVPVYDLSVDENGQVFFTMKRVRGFTLEDVIDGLAKGKDEFVQSFSQRRLLTAFSQACLAVDFAHQRGVLHRDLKPANIMLGDYGEVYVLDWGLAGIDSSVGSEDESKLVDEELDSGIVAETSPGKMFGTPGYASPEQLSGDLAKLGPTTDVYALGAILFEIACHSFLHPRRSVPEIVASTLSGALSRPSIRAPDKNVPPEIEEFIVRATELEPTERYTDARELHQAIEGFLDGQRDVERRQELADQHARAASKHAAADIGRSADARKAAMKEVGRALTLDPENERARRVLRRVLTQPPKEMPPDVRAQLESRHDDRHRWMSKLGAITYAGLLLYVPFIVAAGVREWGAIIAFILFIAIAGVLCLVTARQLKPNTKFILGSMIASNLGMACTAAFFGPLLVTPAVIAINTTPFALYLQGIHRHISIITAFIIVISVIGASMFGIIPATYEFTGDTMVIHAGSISLAEATTMALLIAIALGHVVTNAVVIGRIQSDLHRVEEQLLLNSWHLQNLAPTSGAELMSGADATGKFSVEKEPT